ncbi:hypothetical protein EV356DRAFT_346818 [Viridothelium virens]|uniref:FYVE-domain-containing protein n=1 Tax=Viridothelium virens TaxID=1048519 RepID=A0A6A6GY47_VIRVR|nr:hypothetical protein EV356DRAFT_346818 [Viridothelium virens]
MEFQHVSNPPSSSSDPSHVLPPHSNPSNSGPQTLGSSAISTGESRFLERRGHSDSTVSRQPPRLLRASASTIHPNAKQTRYRRRTSQERNLGVQDRLGVRTDGGTVRSLGDIVLDRKRRLTAPSSPGRRGSGVEDAGLGRQLAEGIAEMTGLSGASSWAHDRIGENQSSTGSRATPIDLTGLDRPPVSTPTRQNQEGRRRGNEYVLPRWQPDSEVSHCPVCGTAFSFFFRKHHCRKCGRVVCATCSPHRITIPRQFIIHPSEFSVGPGDQPVGAVVDLTGESDANSPRHPVIQAQGQARPDSSSHASFSFNTALDGGEVVRVCNPCVPDPNFSPPPQLSPPYSSYTSLNLRQQSSTQQPGHVPFSVSNPPRQPDASSSNSLSAPRSHPAQLAFRSQDHTDSSGTLPSHRNAFSQRYERHHDMLRHRRRTLPHDYQYNSWNLAGISSQLNQRQPFPPSNLPRHHPNNSNSNSTPHFSPGLPFGFFPNSSSENQRPSGRSINFNAPLPPIPRPTELAPFPAPVPPRASYVPPHPPEPPRQIPEEDECPVCGNELPSKGPDDDEGDRERHIDQCIRDHAYGKASSAAHQDPTNVPLDANPVAAVSSSSASALLSQSTPAFYNQSFTPPQFHSVDSPEASATSSRENPSAAASVSRPRRQTGTRMLIYRASEKDCVDEGGGSQECVICFEEFEDGQEMGRLECLCKFHRTCIRQWWDTKGAGSCPTHQLHS